MMTTFYDLTGAHRSTDYPSEAADGTPHLAYFAEDVSFVWSGNLEHPVQVCPGGYGEPVTETFDLPRPPAVTWWVILAWFREWCDAWLRGEVG